ncbi:MAG: RraA family protein [Chloroflexi bacterium]|nr:RraA family protein [Chloroflexota bacterium]
MTSTSPIDSNLERLQRVYVAVVSDALDALDLRHQVMAPRVRPLYPEARIVGRAHPIHFRPAERVPSQAEYHYMEIEAMDSLLPGEVYVGTLGDAPPCALFGELFSTCAKARGATGAVIDGPVRDSGMIIAKPYPVFATAFSAADAAGRAEAIAHNVPITCGGVLVHPGDYILAEYDGVVVIPHQHIEAVLQPAEEKVRGENTVRAELAEGEKMRTVFERHGIL